jgi:hypothetical protein
MRAGDTRSNRKAVAVYSRTTNLAEGLTHTEHAWRLLLARLDVREESVLRWELGEAQDGVIVVALSYGARGVEQRRAWVHVGQPCLAGMVVGRSGW